VFSGVWLCVAVRAWRGHAAGCGGFVPSASRITSASSRPPSARARACHLVGGLGVAGCGTSRGAAAAYTRAVSQRVEWRVLILQGERKMAHTTIADLTVDDLRKLIRETVIQTFFELLGDPDEGLELRDEFKLELQRALATDETGKTIPAQDVAARLGLTW